MSGLINLAMVALKSALNKKFEDNTIKSIIEQTMDIGFENVNKYIIESRNEIHYILSDKKMDEMFISEERREYIRSELMDLIMNIKLDDDIIYACKYDISNLEEELWYEYLRNKKIPIEFKDDIRKMLFSISKKAVELAKSRENFVEDSLVKIMNSNREINEMHKDVKEIRELLVDICDCNKNISPPWLHNKFLEYVEKWNKNMFLNDFDDEDENAGINVKLRDCYILPYYRLNGQKRILSTLEKRLFSLKEKKNTFGSMLLILGQPGIGKSSLIIWFVNQYIRKKKTDEEILVYRFTDFNIQWESKNDNITKEILNQLEKTERDLENKILILDGFDEINAGDNRVEILNSFYNLWIMNENIKNFSLLITCRENYIRNIRDVKCTYITLEPWDIHQISSFYNNYQLKCGKNISNVVIENLNRKNDVFGIPLILYMVLALDITVKSENSVVDVYDQIFSLDGGIYERCVRREKKESWDNEHRIAKIKYQIHQISREIAVWIFENNPEEAYITQNGYEKICEGIQKQMMLQENLKQDFMIGNYFKLIRHCEGVETDEICFVHRSLYEYFVAETIYNSIERALNELSEDSQDRFASSIVVFLKCGKITYTIGEYLKYKILILYAKLEYEKQEKFYLWWEKTIEKMLSVGMFYFIDIKNYKNIICKEVICFRNLMEILNILFELNKNKYIMENVSMQNFERYVRHYIVEQENNKDISLNLSNICLNGTDLQRLDLRKVLFSKASLKGANLREANLRGVDLRRADLREANLEKANLEKADLGEANLRGANLRGANLRGADLRRADLREADLKEANLVITDLRDSDLRGTIFNGADLKGANLEGAHQIYIK